MLQENFIALLAQDRGADAKAMLQDDLSNRVLASLEERKRELAQGLFSGQTEQVTEEDQLEEAALKPVTQYTYVPNRGHFVGGKKGDKAFQKHQTEYLQRKKIGVREETESDKKDEHSDEVADTKLVKKLVKKDCLTEK